MAIRIASAPVNWGVLLKDTPNVPPWERVLDEIAAAGYAGTELGPYGFLPPDAARLRHELASRGLSLVAAFVPLNLRDPDARPQEHAEAYEVAGYLAAAGADHVVLSDALFVDANRAARAGRVRPEDSLPDAEWPTFLANLETFARRVGDEYGLGIAFHPHAGSWIEAPWEVDRLLDSTDPDLVGLCLETGHSTYGGDDPVDLYRRWRERVSYIHFKDCDHRVLAAVRAAGRDYFAAVRAGLFPELGQGDVDFPKLARELSDYDGWATVEQDVLPGMDVDPPAAAHRNREYLREVLG